VNQEIQKVLARQVAKYIIETHAEDIESLSIAEMTWDQVEGFDSDTGLGIEELVRNYIKVSNVHVSFDEHRLDAAGNLLTEEQLKERYRLTEPFPEF
jgi:hypothetical protein